VTGVTRDTPRGGFVGDIKALAAESAGTLEHFRGSGARRLPQTRDLHMSGIAAAPSRVRAMRGERI
jgi:hypothetical protein